MARVLFLKLRPCWDHATSLMLTVYSYYLCLECSSPHSTCWLFGGTACLDCYLFPAWFVPLMACQKKQDLPPIPSFTLLYIISPSIWDSFLSFILPPPKLLFRKPLPSKNYTVLGNIMLFLKWRRRLKVRSALEHWWKLSVYNNTLNRAMKILMFSEVYTDTPGKSQTTSLLENKQTVSPQDAHHRILDSLPALTRMEKSFH